MRIEMKMPDLAATESEIRIVRWLVQPGQPIARGQMFVEVETDKATMEVESASNGVVQEIRCQPGETVAVGDVVALLETDPAEQPAGCEAATAASSPALHAAATPDATDSLTPSASTQLGTSPAGRPNNMFARNRAAADAAKTVKAAAPAGIVLSVAERTAARRLQESKQTIPHYYLQTSFNAAPIMKRRAAVQSARLAWDAFFVRAVARALNEFERFCCRFEGEQLTRCESDAIGVAIDESDNLYVIPIAAPLRKSIAEISTDLQTGLQQLRSGDPDARRIRPNLMTITNLGMCNVESFVPIINPPEAAILGIGKAMPVTVAFDDGRIGVQQRCTLTLCVDHRVASGRYAARFLDAVVSELESADE